jgi:UDP-N-acetylmuramyl pentapeptide phosphotransferase/UDP-N-acetylglucosamine-1-phosphate transferase
MFGGLDKYIAVFLTGLVVTYFLTPLVRAVAVRFGIVDLPNERRPHRRPTARGGGLAVVLGVHAACLMALAFPWPEVAGQLNLAWWKHFAAASAVLLAVGLIDDIRGLGPWPKLGGQVIAGLLISFTGTRFGSLLGFELPGWLDSTLVVVWLVAMINAFNLIDGLDGLASGLAIISAIGLGGIFVIEHLPANVLILLGLIGACLGFLRYNFHPATIFLGDTGSMFLGFILGVVSLQTFTKNTLILSFTIPMLVLGVPIYDTLLAIWRRSVRLWLTKDQPVNGEKRSGIMQADVQHIHHRLLKAGLSTRGVATLLCGANALLVGFGLLITTFQSHSAGIFLIALLAGVYVLLRHMAAIELRDTGKVLLTGLRRPTHTTFKALFYPVWDMTWMVGSLAIGMWVIEGSRVDFWHTGLLELPIWVTPTFTLLAMSRNYVIVWTRARTRDVLGLIFTLQAGLLLSLAIALVIEPAELRRYLLRMLVVGGISHPAIVGSRVIYRFLEEAVAWLKSQSEEDSETGRVLLYGAGGRCQLFFKEHGFSNSRSFDGRVIVGLIDDESSLQFQWVQGYKVLGSLKDLSQLISRHRITGIIITTVLAPAKRAAVEELARRRGLQLTEWCFREQEICGTAPRIAAEANSVATPLPLPIQS